MKKCILVFLSFGASLFSVKAQILKQFAVEESSESVSRVFIECGSPSLGVLVFKSAIEGLQFELNMPTRLDNVTYNNQRNEYVLCVQPTDRLYWVTITGQGYESVDFEVRNIQPSVAQYFKIDPKGISSEIGDGFIGVWGGTIMRNNVIVVSTESGWSLHIPRTGHTESGTYTMDGITANLYSEGQNVGMAIIIDGNTVSITLNSNSFAPGTYSLASSSRGIAGLWGGNILGHDVTIVGTASDWSFSIPEIGFSDRGTYRMTGATANLLSDNARGRSVGNAVIVDSNTIRITLISTSIAPGTHTLTRRSPNVGR